MAKPDVFVANTSAVFDYEGRRIILRKGVTTVRSGHPILKGRERLFDPIRVDFDTDDKPESVARRRRPSEPATDAED